MSLVFPSAELSSSTLGGVAAFRIVVPGDWLAAEVRVVTERYSTSVSYCSLASGDLHRSVRSH